MKKFVIITGVAVALLIILGFVAKFFVTQHKKSFSPEEEVTYNSGELISMFSTTDLTKKVGKSLAGSYPTIKFGEREQTRLQHFRPTKICRLRERRLKEESIRYGLFQVKKPGKSFLILSTANGVSAPMEKPTAIPPKMFSP